MGIWGLSLTLLIVCFPGELWGWTPISYLFCILHSLRSCPLGAGRCSVEIWLGGRLDGRPGRVASESLRRPFCSADHSRYARCAGELLSNRHRQSRQKEAGETTSFLTVPKTPCGERLIPSKIPVTVVPQFTPRTEIMCFCCPPASSPIYHGARVTPAECPHS